MRRILLLALALAACEAEVPTVNGYPAYDLWQNRYPAACMRDLSDVRVPISLVSRERLTELSLGKAPPKPGWRILGWFQHSPQHIFIWNGLSGRELNEAIRHERCHVVAGEWHT